MRTSVHKNNEGDNDNHNVDTGAGPDYDIVKDTNTHKTNPILSDQDQPNNNDVHDNGRDVTHLSTIFAKQEKR